MNVLSIDHTMMCFSLFFFNLFFIYVSVIPFRDRINKYLILQFSTLKEVSGKKLNLVCILGGQKKKLFYTFQNNLKRQKIFTKDKREF